MESSIYTQQLYKKCQDHHSLGSKITQRLDHDVAEQDLLRSNPCSNCTLIELNLHQQADCKVQQPKTVFKLKIRGRYKGQHRGKRFEFKD